MGVIEALCWWGVLCVVLVCVLLFTTTPSAIGPAVVLAALLVVSLRNWLVRRLFLGLTLIFILVVGAAVEGPVVWRIRQDQREWSACQNDPVRLRTYARGDGRHTTDAWHQLIAHGDPADVVEALSSRDMTVSSSAEQKLRDMVRVPSLATQVASILDEAPDPGPALDALGDSLREAGPALAPTLERIVLSDRYEGLRKRALQLLLKVDTDTAATHYRRILRDDTGQALALEALRNNARMCAVLQPELLNLAKSPQDAVRGLLIPLLEPLGRRPAVVAALRRFLSSDSIVVRLDTRDALGRLGEPIGTLSVLRDPVRGKKYVRVVVLDTGFGPGGHGAAVVEIVRAVFKGGDIVTIDVGGRSPTQALIEAVLERDDTRFVVNMSYGTSYDVISQIVFRLLLDRGVLFVAAAGNDAKEACSYPAADSSVLAVGAVVKIGENNFERTSYTNYGDCISFYADDDSATALDRLKRNFDERILAIERQKADLPMREVPPRPDDGYAESLAELVRQIEQLKATAQEIDAAQLKQMGTSFTAPKVTGALASLLVANPELSRADLRRILSETKAGRAEGRDVVDPVRAFVVAYRTSARGFHRPIDARR